MYRGALMPPSPIRPMNSPWPIHSGHGGPNVEMVRPRPIIDEPEITVQRVPTRSASRDMMMPPTPEPSHASALASAGTERDPPTSAAMSLSATAVIQAAPKDIARISSATEATAQEALVSIERAGKGSIGESNPVGGRLSQAAPDFTIHLRAGLLYARGPIAPASRRPTRMPMPACPRDRPRG